MLKKSYFSSERSHANFSLVTFQIWLKRLNWVGPNWLGLHIDFGISITLFNCCQKQSEVAGKCKMVCIYSAIVFQMFLSPEWKGNRSVLKGHWEQCQTTTIISTNLLQRGLTDSNFCLLLCNHVGSIFDIIHLVLSLGLCTRISCSWLCVKWYRDTVVYPISFFTALTCLIRTDSSWRVQGK